jgi:chemotaxis family two-component system sensor kinase Cph1
MNPSEVNLTNCDIEPIRTPGHIQSHGFMLVVDESGTIQSYSENIFEFIPGLASNLKGRGLSHIEELLGTIYQPNFISQLISPKKTKKDFERINPVPITIAGTAYYLIISISQEYFLLEFEPAISNFDLDVQSMMGQSIAEILTYTAIEQLLDNSASQVKQIIDFDRVMIYRFASDGHGVVVAEARNENLESWLGLHYPASDIPKQARELYKANLTRLISDVDSIPVKISQPEGQSNLDLSFAQLRAVSPIHIQYLKNMGVASSFSISLKYKDELWGLIACHNYTPRFIDFKSREYAKLIGQILSSALEFRQNEEIMQIKDTFKVNLEKIIKQLLESENIETALTTGSTTLLDIVKSTGAALVHDKKIYKLGNTPNDKQLLDLVLWTTRNVEDALFKTDQFSAVYPEALSYKDCASGVMIAVLSKELGDYLIWFREEQIETVNWAGDPNKPVLVNANGLLDLSPRNSFEVWSETVSGIAEDWSLEEVKAVIKLKEEINYNLNHKAGATRLMNERLKLAYEELESFSYTISHDLKNPLASIKVYAQLLIRDQTILERGQQMLQRIADRADQMHLMINAVLDYSRIGRTPLQFVPIATDKLIADVLKDLDPLYDHSKLTITVGDTPELIGDPTMIYQVFSNLISNAVKYSQQSNPAIIHIGGKKSDLTTTYTVSDNGLGIKKDNLPKIFELFNRMENVQHIEGSGVGLAIVKRIVEKHQGTISAESIFGEGSVFNLVLNN